MMNDDRKPYPISWVWFTINDKNINTILEPYTMINDGWEQDKLNDQEKDRSCPKQDQYNMSEI